MKIQTSTVRIAIIISCVPLFVRCTCSDVVVKVLEAKTPSAMLGVEGEDARKDSRMIRDDRVQEKQKQVRCTVLK